ncbi:MAG: DUF1236 domain-containing protein [Pseudolabrys sp.]
MSLPASAATTLASATTPLNLRSGPGPEYGVIGAIPDHGQVAILGCIQGSLWCQVDYKGQQGWAYSEYLSGTISGRTLAISQAVNGLPAVNYAPAPGTTIVPPPTINGTFVARTGNAPMSIAPPPPTVTTYVTTNRLQPVYLNGEVVEGVGLPDTVALTPVPGSDYHYAYVNGVPVLVEPQTRRVVYIYR